MLGRAFRYAVVGVALAAASGCNTIQVIDKDTCIAQDQEGLDVNGIIIKVSFFLSVNSYLHRGCELGLLLQNLTKKSVTLEEGELKILHPEILGFLYNILGIMHQNADNEDLRTAMGMVELTLREMKIIPQRAESLETLLAILRSPPLTGNCDYTGRRTSVGLEVLCGRRATAPSPPT